MRYQINDKSGNRLGVMDLEVSAIDLVQALQRMRCVLGPQMPDEITAPVTAAKVEVASSGTTKRGKRGSRK